MANTDARGRVPAQRRSVRGQIIDALRKALAEGELAAGEVYSAPALGARFGVSATPVREAMQRLAYEGLVEVVPNRGFRVLVAEGDPAELAEIRALLVIPAVLGLSGQDFRATAGGLDDAAFWQTLLAAGGNRTLARLAADLYTRAQPQPMCPEAREALLAALARGDRAGAEAYLRLLLPARIPAKAPDRG